MKRWRDLVSTVCGLIAAVFLAAMLLLTVADVTLRATLNVPIRGVYDLVELFLAATFFFALPCVFLRDENIVVNSIDDMAPRWVPSLKRLRGTGRRGRACRDGVAGLLAARDSYEFNDVTADLGLPRLWHWLTLLIGVIGAAIAAFVMALARRRALQGSPRGTP